jgi:inner membrane protein
VPTLAKPNGDPRSAECMDPLTHALLGGVAAHALLPRRLAGRAWMVGAAAALLPDADVLIRSAADPLLAIEHHRGFTHALAFAPLGAAVAALPWLAARPMRAERGALYLAALVGYASHGPLDAATTYGTQLLWPFAAVRSAWHLVSIIDPLVTLLLAVGLAVSLRVRTAAPAVAALLACAAYLGLGGVQRERALAYQARLAVERGHDRTRGAVFPTVANRLVWRSLYLDGDSLHAERLRVPFRGGPTAGDGYRVARLREADLPAGLRGDPRILRDFRRFAWFSDGWLARAPADTGMIGDARYSLRADAYEPVWGIRFRPGDDPPTRWVDRSRERRLR